MPIYEYKCQKCGYVFEQLQKMTDDPLRVCPECGEEQLVKLVSNTSFQLKGTGWYATDFKDKKPDKKSGASNVKPTKKEAEIKDKSKADKKTKDTETK
jgi:putative FmdB family regulatory protein